MKAAARSKWENFFWILTILAGTTSARVHGAPYQVVRLGDLGVNSSGVASSAALDINSAGDVVGRSTKYSVGANLGDRAVLWPAGQTTPIELGLIGATSNGASMSQALSINAFGDIVGSAHKYVFDSDQGEYGVLWPRGQLTASVLGTLNNARTIASAINASGQIVGTSLKSSQDYGVRWPPGQTVPTQLGNLGMLQGFSETNAFDVNDSGDAVGSSTKYSPGYGGVRAVRWAAGQIAAIELSNLGVNSASFTNSTAWAINGAGDIVGSAGKFSGDTPLGSRAVRWDSGQTAALELGTLGTNSAGVTSSNALDINSAGLIVGFAEVYAGDADLGSHATIWLPGQTAAIDLNSLIDPNSGWVLQRANAINDAGTIAGEGLYDPDGAGPTPAQQLAFRIDGVPEPSLLTLLGLTLILPARRSRRKSGRSRAA